MPLKKLTYFNGRGRGEIIRLVLHATNENFDDERLTHEDWVTRKPSIKYGQLPVMTLENGAQMNESVAIARYLGREAGLYGKNNWETYLVDRALDTTYEFIAKVGPARLEKDEARKEILMKELYDVHVPKFLGNLTSYIEEVKGDFFTGSSPTVADICLIAILDNLVESKPKFPILENTYNKTIEAFPGIKKYLETRPVTQF